jgi:ribulose-5-phosphate 4-epimerase/fuculose-1-phosphate aldolase
MAADRLALAAHDRPEMDYAEQRTALACAFRWAARFDLHESVANHFSLAVNETGTRFLMNPRGRHFSLIRASELLLLDAADNATMRRSDAPDPTAWALHGAIHRRVPHARCLLHVHSRYATVLACLADPTLPPIDQNAMRFWGRVTVDEQFEGMGLDDEAERVAAMIGGNPILLMRNHGVMVVGETVAQAFDDLYYFERSCETFITALQTGRELKIVSDDVAATTRQQWLDYPDLSDDHFRELGAILDREDPSYRN